MLPLLQIPNSLVQKTLQPVLQQRQKKRLRVVSFHCHHHQLYRNTLSNWLMQETQSVLSSANCPLQGAVGALKTSCDMC